MRSNNITTPWEQTKNSFKSFKDRYVNTTSKATSTFKANVEDLPEFLAGLKTNVNKAVRTKAKSLSKLLEGKVQDTGKNPVNVETKRKYEVEDLPKFFKDKSKEIGKAFSDEVVEISTIRSRSVASDTQEFSFKLKLLTAVDEDVSNIILPQTSHLIGFFKIYLLQEKSFTANIKVPQESSELYNNHCKANKTVEEFISNAPIQILLQGITITLQTNVKNINLNSLQQIEAFLNEQLKHVEKAKSEEQSQDTLQVEETENKNENVVEKGNTQGKQIVQDSFGYNIASNRKQITCAPVIVAAMHENFSWLRSFFRLPNFFNTIQFFFQQLSKFSIQKQKALTYHAALQNQKCAKNDQEISTTRLDTDCSAELSEESLVIKQAECDARVAMVDNELKNRPLSKLG